MNDPGPIFERGGFGDSSTSPMSDDLRIRMEAAESIVEAEIAKQERERKVRVEALQERAIQAAISQAIEEGQVFSPAMLRGQNIGHEPHEFIALASARMDREDAHLEAQKAAEYRRWEAEHYSNTSADTSAPTRLQAEEGHQMQARAARYREKEYERQLVARGIRAGVY